MSLKSLYWFLNISLQHAVIIHVLGKVININIKLFSVNGSNEDGVRVPGSVIKPC